MKHIEQLITYLPTILNNKGTLFLEHDPWQAEPVRILCEKNGFQTQIHADQYQNVRMTSIYRPL
jgi:methylase of polypeptide subunit release factors